MDAIVKVFNFLINNINIWLPIAGWIIIIWNSRLLIKRAEIRDCCKESKSIIDDIQQSCLQAANSDINRSAIEASITSKLAAIETLYERTLKDHIDDPIDEIAFVRLRHRTTINIESLHNKSEADKKAYIENISTQCIDLKAKIDLAFISKFWNSKN